MEYKDTLNLPKTSFSMKANLPDKEPLIFRDWERAGIYSLIRMASSGKKKFILHDGPPYANGNIHIGHALNKILKDMVVKFNTMKGMDAPFVPGWDCHGLPVEHQLFKELKVSRHDIEQVSFRKKAHKYAMKFVKTQKEEFKRLGIFGDWDAPYLTLDPKYEAGIIESFARLVEEGYIYKDLKPVNWCGVCETALAEAEVEYRDKKSSSIFVRFKVDNTNASPAIKGSGDDVYFLIWTTTPWTLVSNAGIAVHPKLNYAVIETDRGTLILAEELLDGLLNKLSFKKTKIIKKILGSKLEGIVCNHPFIERKSRVVLADYVSNKEGSGCVHIAPGHGQEDYLVGRAYSLPVIMPVDSKGRFDASAGKFTGLSIKEANEEILKDLKSTNDLIYAEEIAHSYPHCWRCKSAIIFRSTEQYFMSIDKHNLRKKLLDIIKKIKWVPGAGIGRISSMIEKRPDWCLSRQRYWGVPIPAFYCTECNELLLDARAIRNVARIIEQDGSNAFFLKDAEELLPPGIKCKKCKKSAFKKETDILDVWFESGVSHQSVLKERNEFPADLYLEGSDQHRGWFQSALITSFAIEKKPSYHTVLTHGFVVDGEGKKMSKSLGNVIAPQEIIKRFGADVLRLWVASSDYNEDVRLSEEILKTLGDAYRKIRNTLRYFLGNIYSFDLKKKCHYNDMLEIDKYALCETKKLLKAVEGYYENYNFHMVYHSIYNFCTVTMSSIYLDILKDRLYTFAAHSHARNSAKTALHTILSSLTRMLAPILCFTAEEVWSKMPHSSGESVHLAPWPELDDVREASKLTGKYERLFKIREKVLFILEKRRQEKIIGAPLEAKVILRVKSSEEYKFLKDNERELSSIFIVSQVSLLRQAKPEKEGLIIEVVKADGAKCQRCWNYSPSVGKNTTHKEICERCVEVVKKCQEK